MRVGCRAVGILCGNHPSAVIHAVVAPPKRYAQTSGTPVRWLRLARRGQSCSRTGRRFSLTSSLPHRKGAPVTLFPLRCRSAPGRGDYTGSFLLAKNYVDETLSTGSASLCTSRFSLIRVRIFAHRLMVLRTAFICWANVCLCFSQAGVASRWLSHVRPVCRVSGGATVYWSCVIAQQL